MKGPYTVRVNGKSQMNERIHRETPDPTSFQSGVGYVVGIPEH